MPSSPGTAARPADSMPASTAGSARATRRKTCARTPRARPACPAALVPMLRQRSYEVGPEFVARFLDADASNARFFAGAKADGHARFDLAGHILSRLERAQVGRVEDLGRCTYAEAENFFSYRRATHRAEPDYGRHISAIALVG